MPSLNKESPFLINLKRSSREKGIIIETLAADYLQQRELQILQRNFRCRLGEIDLIAVQDQTLIFVEVRFRKNAQYGGPLESIGCQKQRKLIRTAEFFLKTHPRYRSAFCRFDVIAVSMDNGLPNVEWIQNAFQSF